MFIVKSNCGTGCRFLVRAAVVISLGLATLAFVPTVTGTLSFAQAQVSESADFRVALEPYGRWERHSRWGEVWIPTKVGRDWRPYTVGRWAYTDDWGWYWVSDQPEDDWGWITFHYGRWVFDRELRWVWVAGREWGPGWVQWRRGTQYVGWAPLPPDEIVVEYRDEPDVWIFVRSRDFVAPRLVSVILPARQQDVFIHETVVVNQTIILRERGPAVAVNPGIAPAIIAAAVARPLRTFEVRPRILAGTAQIQGAAEVRPQDLRQGRAQRTQVTVRETKNVIQPSQNVPPAQALAAGERGRLGDNPPRAARQGGREPTTGQGPAGGNQQQGNSVNRVRSNRIKRVSRECRAGDPISAPATEGRGPQRSSASHRGPRAAAEAAATSHRGPRAAAEAAAAGHRGPRAAAEASRPPGHRGPRAAAEAAAASHRGPRAAAEAAAASHRGPRAAAEAAAASFRGAWRRTPEAVVQRTSGHGAGGVRRPFRHCALRTVTLQRVWGTRASRRRST